MSQRQSAIVRHYFLTWGINETFGGMTSMCLYRSRMFWQVGDIHATVLTFDVNAQYDLTLEKLRTEGTLSRDTAVLNIYMEHRRVSSWIHSAKRLTNPLVNNGFVASGALHRSDYDTDARLFSRTSMSDDGSQISRREFFRPDGSRFAREEWQIPPRGDPYKVISLLNQDGAIVRQYTDEHSWYRDWLLELSNSEPTALVADSPRCSKFIAPLRESHIIKFTVYHTNHVAKGGDPHRGRLAAGRQHVVEKPHDWDGIVFLTEEQRRDYMWRFGTTSNLFTISNPRPRPESLPSPELRIRNRGVMVSRLTRDKNILAAINIIDKARTEVPGIFLDIYGDGPRRKPLQRAIDARGLTQHIRLLGHVPNVAEEFSTAGFSLLTSKHEGQSLAIMESQARGCPPVAFDIRYGPSDLIQDGRNGFLTKYGDTPLASQRVVQLCKDTKLSAEIGLQGWLTSQRFEDERMFLKWSEMLEGAWQRRHLRTCLHDGNLVLRQASVEVGEMVVKGKATWCTQRSAGDISRPAAWLRIFPWSASVPVWMDVTPRSISKTGVRISTRLTGDFSGSLAYEQSGIPEVLLVIVWNNSRLSFSVPLESGDSDNTLQ